MEKDKEDHPAHAAPVRLAFRVSYLGSRFFGSQMQASHRTVEGEFIAACQRLSLFEDWREAGFPVRRQNRSRRPCTGTGGCIYDSCPRNGRSGPSTLQLPPDCWCTGYAEVPPAFHPRYDAKMRTYRYYFTERSSRCRPDGTGGRQVYREPQFYQLRPARGQEPVPDCPWCNGIAKSPVLSISK